MKVTIVDYGLGNTRSVKAALNRLGAEGQLASDSFLLESADKIILPGVGAFEDGINGLRERGLDTVLSDLVLKKKRHILGICLGAQLLFEKSYEFGEFQGLGFLAGEVISLNDFDGSVRLPHIGWNDVKTAESSVLFQNVENGGVFYFVHSFHCKPKVPSIVTGETDYHQPIAAAFESENIFATQFHPEKSQDLGLKVLGNFLGAKNAS